MLPCYWPRERLGAMAIRTSCLPISTGAPCSRPLIESEKEAAYTSNRSPFWSQKLTLGRPVGASALCQKLLLLPHAAVHGIGLGCLSVPLKRDIRSAPSWPNKSRKRDANSQIEPSFLPPRRTHCRRECESHHLRYERSSTRPLIQTNPGG